MKRMGTGETIRFMTFVVTGLIVPAALPVGAQEPGGPPPVIDVHMHAPMSPGTVEESMPRLYDMLGVMDSLNVRFAVLTGVPDVLFAWNTEIGDRVGVLPSLLFPCENGVAVMHGRPCFEDGADWPDLDRLRGHIEAGRVQGLGEIATQFVGLGPSDPAMEPYFALAEEYDLPVFIHMLPGIVPVAYEGDWPSVRMPNHRGALGNPFLLEDALVKHPGVRVAVVHSGWPMVDEMISILYQHPQVYAEVGLLQATELFPRAEYYALLRRLVRAGFADRILFGSDGSLAEGVAAILEADFLTEQQQRDILCGNAARFLRLEEGTCR